jgi:hypothetical protein
VNQVLNQVVSSKPLKLYSLVCSQPRELIGLNSNRRHSPIHILKDDVLLNIFHLYRLAEPVEYEDENGLSTFKWDRQRWWYKLAHVCQQWRNIILESPSWLDLHLYCTNGVPVSDMLAHSPPLPLTIDYHAVGGEMTVEDESGILLALLHRDRVRHIYFSIFENVGKFFTVMDDQFPILELVHIHSRTKDVALPVTFQAPNLRHLNLWKASIPIGSSLLTTTAAGLVTLELLNIPASAYFPPSHILTRLSLMAQLKKLFIESPIPSRRGDVEMQLHQTPDMTTLPNLRRFEFQGVSAYLEGLVAHITTPSLTVLQIYLFNQLFFTVPHLLQFVQASKNLRFTAVELALRESSVHVIADPWRASSPLQIIIDYLGWEPEVASPLLAFGTLSPLLSAVEQVTLRCEHHYTSLAWHNSLDRRQWRELLGPFINAKTIHVQGDLINKIFHSLPSDDGEPPLELLPNLEGVVYDGGCDAWDAFTRFLKERQVAGHPIRLRLVDQGMSQHNCPYLGRAHIVTPAYSPVHDDHQILVIGEIATKPILVNIGISILDDYHVPFLRFSEYHLSLHTWPSLFAFRARCHILVIVRTPGSTGEYRGDEKVGATRSPKGDQGTCAGREQETPKRDALGQRSGGMFGNAKSNRESVKSRNGISRDENEPEL